MTVTAFRPLCWASGLLAGASLLAASAAAQTPVTILIGTGVVPESIASTPEGALLVGSIVQGTFTALTLTQDRWRPG